MEKEGTQQSEENKKMRRWRIGSRENTTIYGIREKGDCTSNTSEREGEILKKETVLKRCQYTLKCMKGL